MFAPADKPYPADIRPLTSMRFFAAFCIVVRHMAEPFAFVDMESGFLSRAHLAVDFFFMLSGFILYHVYARMILADKGARREFYIRRIARLYPVHLAALALALAASFVYTAMGFMEVATGDTKFSFLTNLLLIHAWGFHDAPTYNVPSWSISAEWFAYLLFPFLVAGIVRTPPLVSFAAAVCFFLTAALAAEKIWGRPLTRLSFDFGIARILPEFLLGMALCRLGQSARMRYCSPNMLISLFVLVLVMMHYESPEIAIVLMFAPLILMGAEQARQGREWRLSSPGAVYLGEISYSMYMFHVPLINLVLTPCIALALPADWLWAAWSGCWILIIAASAASYHIVEVPYRARIRRWSKKTERRK